jgi:AcrR family transcriptional regulator
MPPPEPRPAEQRPRVAGAREEEILDATVTQLLEVGYDRLTMDRVADHAHASKATLYRRWTSKQSLVVDALTRSHSAVDGNEPPDTGSLRSDLLALFHAGGSPPGQDATAIFGMVVTALQTDAEFAAEFRERFLAPKLEVQQRIYQRAAERGELAAGADPSLLGPALPGILLHRALALGEAITADLVERVVDQIIVPAATGRPFTPQEPS